MFKKILPHLFHVIYCLAVVFFGIDSLSLQSIAAVSNISIPLLFGTILAGKGKEFRTLDLYLASYLSLRGHAPTFTLQGTRVIFDFPATDDVYQIAAEYNGNPDILLLDYVSEVRKIRSQMLSVRG